MADKPTQHAIMPPRWKVRLSFAKMALWHTFPSEPNFIGSMWQAWLERIEDGHRAEEERIERLAEKWSSAQEEVDLIADDVHEMLDLTDNMYAALVVSIWAKMEEFLKSVASAVRIGTRIHRRPESFGSIDRYFSDALGISLGVLPGHAIVNSVRVLNNTFKHRDGLYNPDSNKPHETIDEERLNRCNALGPMGRIIYSELPIRELVVACNTFSEDLLTRVEKALRSKTEASHNE